jgi:hypothetical protein
LQDILAMEEFSTVTSGVTLTSEVLSLKRLKGIAPALGADSSTGQMLELW